MTLLSLVPVLPERWVMNWHLRALITLAVMVFPAFAPAAVFHLTPNGAGRKDGSGWPDAADQQALGGIINETMKPGDQLLLGGGQYGAPALVIAKGGSPGKPKTITGVDRGAGLPVFAGEWSCEAPAKGATAVRILPGVSQVVLTGLRFKGFVCAVSAEASDMPRTGLVFKDVDMEQFRHGFFLTDCDDLVMEGCNLKRYTKHAYRFAAGCDRVTIRQCSADCSEADAEWEKKTELFPFGFFINNSGAPNTAFTFEDCLSCNNMMPLQTTKYKNGDGYVVEENAAQVTFLRCRALRNQDGGFDVKVRDVQFTGCVAAGNGRGFRIWKTGSLENCFAGWGASGLWCNGGPVSARRCTFHGLTDAAVLTDDDATQPVTLTECVISNTVEPHRQTARGGIIMTGSIVARVVKPARGPEVTGKYPGWDGLGDAMDDRASPNIGYRSGAVR